MVVGARGSIGSLIVRKLAEAGTQVVGLDIVQAAGTAALTEGVEMRVDDITHPGVDTRRLLCEADVVVLAVSESVLLEAMPMMAPCVQPGGLIVETLSTKSVFAQALQGQEFPQQILGINPMFAGDLDPQGRPVAAVVHRDGLLVQAFIEFVRSWGSQVVNLTPVEHDRTVVHLQALTHLAVLAFGRSLAEPALDLRQLLALAPPPSRVLISLVARMTQNQPEVYWDIQASNPFAVGARASLRAALVELDEAVNSDDRPRFDGMLAELKATFGGSGPGLVDMSRQLFALIGQGVPAAAPVDAERKAPGTLADFRTAIDAIDDGIVDLLAKRLEIVWQVGHTKKATSTPVMQPNRVLEVKARCRARGARQGIRGDFVEALYQQIIDEACRMEYDFTEEQAPGTGVS